MADAPFTPSDYTDLITSEHRGKPKFVSTIETTIDPAVNAQEFLRELPAAFDLDTAVGVQLDAVGAWVGVSRTITTCLINVWFSFDVEGLGFDQGIWKGPYDPDRGLYELDDDTYRALIRLKIKVNTWDGTIETARAAIMDFYAQTDSYPFILDNQDMHMVVCISGKRPIMVMFAIYAGRYVEFKPAGVTMHTVVPSIEYTPAFGFDATGTHVDGLDVGSWVVEADSVLCSGDAEYETTLDRFDPRYWTIDLPLTASAALVTNDASGMTLYATLRAKSDLVGLKWQSEDKWSHRGFGYYTSPNYTGCVLDFDFALTGLDGATSGSLSDVAGLTMTVTDDDGTPYHIRLANYITSGTINSGHIRLDFSGGPVLGGFDPDDATQRVIIPWHRIVEFSIGFAAPDYDKDSPVPLGAKIDVVFAVTNLVVSGQNKTMIQRLVASSSHNVRMCDGGDDAYPLTPERIVTGLVQTGYSGQYVIYIGASHLHELTWDAGAGSFLVDPAHPVSTPVRMWYQDLFTRLVGAGYDPVISQSYEIFAAMCPESWQQRDYTGGGARTGWVPPSTLISPTVSAAMDYIRSVALWMCGALDAAGGDVRYQVGEPWWWDGSYTDGGPCIYDDTTTALYVSETGCAVPTPYLQSITAPVGIHGDYLDWLSGKLGASTLWLRDQVKTAHPSATTYILLFTPQILSPTSEIVTRLNLPVSSWQAPAFDVLQLEDYDWIIAGDWENHARTLSAGTDTLGYALDDIEYFGGFNLLASTASTIWPRITMVINEALTWGIRNVCVWARPQVWRDGWIPVTGRLIGELGASSDVGPNPVTWVFPTDLQMVANTWGDIVLSFAPNQDPVGHIYIVEILDGTTIKRTITVDSPDVVNGRVLVDYPVEESVPDWSYPPTYLKWQVRVDGGTVKTVMDDNVPVNNAGIVKKAIAFAGQSNALGHFTTLSGTDARKDLVSAGSLRRSIASRMGLRDVEVIPVQMAWGSSAADKLADDDPVNGTNYWWDVDAGAAGPRLTEALAISSGLGVEIAAVVWAQGENDAGAMDASAAPRSSTPARYLTATMAIFSALRAGMNNPSLPIWVQTVGRGWWGDEPDTYEVNGANYKAVRDAQVSIAQVDPNVRIGSWVPGSEAVSGYVQEVSNVGWVHYTSGVYQAVAVELAEAVATPLDRMASRPAWTLMGRPELTATVNVYDLTVSWPAVDGTSYVIKNINVLTGDVISTTAVNASSGYCVFTFTGDEQVSIYGYHASAARVIVAQILGGIAGPAADETIDLAGAGGGVGATDMTAKASDWGDILLSFTPAQSDPSIHSYSLNIMDGETVKRTSSLDASSLADGKFVVGYPVEQSVPDFGFPPTYLRWRVVVDDIDATTCDGAPIISNASLVKKTVAFAGQSVALGHFTSLSGAGGRRDLVSAGQIRRALAIAWGLNEWEVMPVQMAWGSAAVERLADDDPVSGVNYWYDLDGGVAGPRLTEALATVAGLGIPLDYLIWDDGQNDAGAMYIARQGDPGGTGRSSTPARFQAATEAIFAAFRSAAGANLPIYIQPLMRAFWSPDGGDTNPVELAGQEYADGRDVQIAIAAAQADTHIGTWMPGAETYAGYTVDFDGTQYQWIHPSPTTYAAAATQLSEAISTPLDRINDAPAWMSASAPTLTAHVDVNDEVLTWPGVDGDVYEVVNTNIEDNSTISITQVTVAGGKGEWTFTESQQIAEYGAGYSRVTAYVTVYKLLTGNVHGLSSTITIVPDEVQPAAPTGLAIAYAPTGDWDIVLAWNAVSGKTYRVVNRSIVDATEISTIDVVATSTTGEWTFAGTDQVTEYGSHTRYLDVDVVEMDGSYEGRAATAVLDAWDRQKIDGTLPAVWADFVRDQATSNGSESSLSSLLTRSGGTKWVIGADGNMAQVPAGTLAFDYSSGRRRLILEGSATNLFVGSAAPATAQSITLAAGTCTVSFWGAGTLGVSQVSGPAWTDEVYGGRHVLTFTATAGDCNFTPNGDVQHVQVESGYATSYIETTTAAATRVTDICGLSGAAVAAVSGGSATIALRCQVNYVNNVSYLIGNASSWIAFDNSAKVHIGNGSGGSDAIVGNVGAGRSISLCLSWDASGRRAAVAGGALLEDSALIATPTALFLGSAWGQLAKKRVQLDELLIWPVKGSAPAIVSQAREWA